MSAGPGFDDATLDGLLDQLLERHGQDFRHYARASLVRRLRRLLDGLGGIDTAELRRRLDADPAVLARVLDTLTVQVTEMYRDPSFYRALREQVLPMLATWPSIKVWIAGCATGEEAWSIAVLLDEEGLLDRSLVYATDISDGALATARRGVYTLDRLAEAARAHAASGGRRPLGEWFSTGYDRAIVDRRLRDHVLFADHSLATDGVFSEVHLVTCRNVLIYFDRHLQDRAVGLFADALVHGGYLGLGSRESLRGNAHADAFEVVDRRERLYRRA